MTIILTLSNILLFAMFVLFASPFIPVIFRGKSSTSDGIATILLVFACYPAWFITTMWWVSLTYGWCK